LVGNHLNRTALRLAHRSSVVEIAVNDRSFNDHDKQLLRNKFVDALFTQTPGATSPSRFAKLAVGV
jgi:hypothetical protein